MNSFKKILIVMTCLVIITFIISGCAEKMSCEPIDVKLIEAYDEQVMEYGYQYDLLYGEFRYLPTGLKTVHHDPVYRVLYKSVYSDGRVTENWQTVTEQEYIKAVEFIRGIGQ